MNAQFQVDDESELVGEGADDPKYTRQEREEDWLYFALSIAQSCRRLMARRDVALTELAIARFERESALKNAVAHAHNLRVEGYGLPHLLITMMEAEGIQ